MLRPHYIFLFILLTINLNLLGQTKIKELLASDSIIVNLHIKQVTENGFGNIQDQVPYWTTQENFDSTGKIIQRITLNRFYWKSVDNFSYDYKKGTVNIRTTFYDFNTHGAKPKKDTTIKTTFEKYYIDGQQVIKNSKKQPMETQTIYKYDSLKRVIESTRILKSGMTKIYYSYNQNGKLVEKKHFTILNQPDDPRLTAIDSFEYNSNGNLSKEINYSEFPDNKGIGKHSREREITYLYNNFELKTEKTITNRYLSLKDSKPSITRYLYDYLYYQ